MKRIIPVLLVLAVLIASVPIYSVYASYPEPLWVEFRKTNGFQKVNFETDATAGYGTKFRTIGWRIQYRQSSGDAWREVKINVKPDEGLKLGYELWLMKLGYETNLGKENTLSDERVQTSIETIVPSGDRDYYRETCKNGGEWKFHAIIQLYINGVPQAGKIADTLEEALALAPWGNNTIDDFHEQYYNRPGVSDPEPAEAFNEVIADFNITYKGDDVTDNSNDPAAIDTSDKSLILTDDSSVSISSDPIEKRKWYYWDVNSGWKEITGSGDKATVTISNMDTGLPGSGKNKAFKLEVTTEKGAWDDESHTAYFKAAPPPPPPPGKADIFVYYLDKKTGADIYPADVTTYKGVDYGTYSIPAKPDTDKIKLDTATTPSPQTVTVNSSNNQATVTFYYNVTGGVKPPAKDPPSAILDLPEEVMAGEKVKADGSKSWSNNPGGYISAYYFEYEGANLISDNGSNVSIWYPNTGTYTVELEVEDEGGRSNWDEKEIEVTPPIPTAVITVTGKLKENRKVTIDSSQSTSPKYYPIDTARTTWIITPLSGGTEADIKYHGVLNGNESKDILFKRAGRYRIRLTVINTYGRSDSTEQTITIAPDLPPVARLYLPTPDGVEYTVYRNPKDSNYATFEMFNESFSPDGDTINKAVMMYCYDSDNDGDYKDEQWYYSKNGTSWTTTGMNYTATVNNFNIFNIATANIPMATLKNKNVGDYYFTIRVMESIPSEETMPEFLTESDYRRADSFN